MKRVLAMLLALIMALSMLPATVFAEEVLVLEDVAEATQAPAEELTEEPAEDSAEKAVEAPAKKNEEEEPVTSGVCGEGLSWTYNDGVLLIYGEGQMDYLDIEALPWAAYLQDITSVIVEEGVQTLDSALYGLVNMTDLSLPGTLREMGMMQFCNSLTTLTIPEGVTTIGHSAISRCDNLQTIILPSTLTTIENYGISFLPNLKNVVLPEGLTQISSYLFTECTSLEKITIPASVKTIGTGAFGLNSALEEVTFLGDVEVIDSSAFQRCSGLKKITFKGNAPVCDSTAFIGVEATVYYPANNPTWTDEVKQKLTFATEWVPVEDLVPGVNCGYEGAHLTAQINGHTAAVAEDGSLIICSCNFPDEGFRNCIREIVVNDRIDGDENGLLTAEELALVVVIDCDYMQINSLKGIEFFGELTELYCSGNNLEAVDVSSNTLLEELNCDECGLSSLDVSANTKLTHLSVYGNNLLTLDVSKNTALKYLECGSNQLTELNVTNNPALTHLWCGTNRLLMLDLSANSALTNLGFFVNNLSALDTSNLSNLVVLQCWGNNLNALNVSNMASLEQLDCAGNQLTSLDVTNNTALHTLTCGGNRLTSLDVSNNTALEVLSCNGNDLGELDVTKNTKLQNLNCGACCLTSLDLSANTELVEFACWANELTELDFQYNTKLQNIDCTSNQLAALDLSGLSELQYLDCSSNRLTSLDCSGNPALKNLTCINNSLTRLNLTGCDALTEVLCFDQYWNGELATEISEQGWYDVKLSDITDVGKINRIITEGECELYPADGVVSFENDPSNGFGYEYLTGWDDHVITVMVNAGGASGGGGGGGDATLPELDEMIQLLLEEEVSVPWNTGDEYKWFYFIPEENMEFTFLTTVNTAQDECLDPFVYWMDEDGNVLEESDDDGSNLNSAIFVEAEAGVPYYFAARNLNEYSGDLSVVVLEGNHVHSGGSGPVMDVPSLEEMTVLELDTDFVAQVAANQYSWFTFTPAQSGNYAFVADRGENPDYPVDPFCYLLDADHEILQEDDDSAGNLNFSVTYYLEAGETYIYAVRSLNNFDASFTVRLTGAKEVVGLSVKPVTIPEGSWCAYNFVMTEEGLEANPYYYWHEKMEVTLTFSDGSKASGVGKTITHEGVAYSVGTFDYQNYGIDIWKAGKTYDVKVFYGELEAETTVKITSSPIKSVSFEDVVLVENTCGEWVTEYYEDEDGNEIEEEYFRYYWEEAMKMTVTFKDGKKVTNKQGNFVEYKGDIYPVTAMNVQWPGNPWQAGNTYEVTVQMGKFTKSVDVTILGITEDLAPVEGLKITSVGETSVKIAFDEVEGADRYEIFVDDTYWGNTTKTSYTISGLTLGYDYRVYVVAAQKVDGAWLCGPQSDVIWARAYRDISDYYLKLEYSSTVYDGTEKRPEITLKKSSSGKTIASEHYRFYYGFNLEVGQAWVEVDGMGQYGGTVLKAFKILPQQVTGVEVAEVTTDSVTITFDSVHGATEYWIYNGSKRVGKTEDTAYTITGLKTGTTYKFSVRANAVVEELKPDFEKNELVPDEVVDYTGKASATVSAKPVYRMEECEVTVKDFVKAYTGKKITNSFTVKNPDGKTVKKDTDYTVSYENNVELGAAIATLKGKGKYAGEIQCVFFIGPSAVKGVEAEVIDGTSVTVSYKEQKGADYYYIYADGQHVGTTDEDEYTITGLTAGHKYSITVAAMIDHENVGELVGVQSKAVTATPRHDIEDCNIVLSEESFYYTGKYQRPTVQVYFGELLLTEGVDYTLSFKNNKNTGRAYVDIKGKGAFEDTERVYYEILPAQVEDVRISATTKTSVKIKFDKNSTNSTKYYRVYVNGEYLGRTTSSTYTIKNLTLGEVYSVYVVGEKTVSGKTYYGPASQTMEVWPGTEIDGYKVTLAYTTAVYNGECHEPAVTVKTSSKSDAITLVKDVDYTVTYVNVMNPGKGSVIIEGKGVYTGTVVKTFKIVPGQVQNVAAVNLSTTSIEVRFDAVPGATEYWVYVNGSRKDKVTDTSCIIKGLKKGKTYNVTVKAVADVDGTDYAGALSEICKITAEEPKDDRVKVAFVTKVVGQAWWDYVRTGVDAWAAENSNYEVFYDGPRTIDSTKQVQIITDLVNQGDVDVLCIAPLDPAACEEICKKAREKGIVVITTEAGTMTNVDYNIEPYNDKGMGTFLMDELANMMDQEGEYVTMTGSATMVSHNNWADIAVAHQQEAYPNMTLIEEERVYSEHDSMTAYQVTKELLQKYPNLKGILGTSSFDAPGVAVALEELGLTGKVFTISMGVPSEVRSYLKDGILQSVALWDPALTAQAMLNLGVALHNGAAVTTGTNLKVAGYESITIDGTLAVGDACIAITKDNVDQFTF